MKKKKCSKLVPGWILSHLKMYNNCACGYEIVKKLGEEKLLNLLKCAGYECSLRIIPDSESYIKRKLKYPPDAYYILDVEKVLMRSI